MPSESLRATQLNEIFNDQVNPSMVQNTDFVEREGGTFAHEGVYEPERKDS